ncbi:hypothetical protein SYNTR_0983 [Candidatus Syntrophocurvum alkaliphilum]|uniref:SMODS and SLOG-associating 2TM effector domain-containing protein n=1 Tax=Candidatus Syntrophocurvum alkaliphilum TaxID=2293317 RepID=A0A6I6DEC0_9FIRM|nr:DUF2663 family protein [Candidatus Syntrophocurvum alkaliphilum]QGT99576.1 hypothetical protein SYNTR_0983 [Candidatus Syntrophocurvum alkaliphilum]
MMTDLTYLSESSKVVTAKLIECSKQKETLVYINKFITIFLISLSILFFVINGIDIRNWFEGTINYLLLNICIITVMIYVYLNKKIAKVNTEFNNYKHIIQKRLESKLCLCGVSCNHYEDYLKTMKDKYNINLYY